jgi:two-component system LytT family response regulator
MNKVLVIDDENKTREFIAKLIRSFGLDLEVIAQGENVETALAAIEEHQPDIVLLDIQMPDGTGFDVLQRTLTKNFEVIFITAHQEFAIKAIKFSALDYILKPVDPEELRDAIEHAIKAVSEMTLI